MTAQVERAIAAGLIVPPGPVRRQRYVIHTPESRAAHRVRMRAAWVRRRAQVAVK